MTQLLDWVEEHEVAFTYDWRTRFGLPLRSIGTADLTWREAWALTVALLEDPTSLVAVAVGRYDRTWSREAAILADLWDLLVRVNTEKAKQGSAPSYPRPAQARPERVRDPRLDEAWRAHLRRVGHTIGITPPALPAAPFLPELSASQDVPPAPSTVTTSTGTEVIVG